MTKKKYFKNPKAIYIQVSKIFIYKLMTGKWSFSGILKISQVQLWQGMVRSFQTYKPTVMAGLKHIKVKTSAEIQLIR